MQVLTEGEVCPLALGVEVGQRFAVEAQDIPEHAPETHRQQIAPLRKQGVQAVPVVGQAACRVVHREAHFGWQRGDPELVEQADEMRVGPVIEDDETGVDGVGRAATADIDRVGMPADPAVGFEHRHLMPA